MKWLSSDPWRYAIKTNSQLKIHISRSSWAFQMLMWWSWVTPESGLQPTLWPIWSPGPTQRKTSQGAGSHFSSIYWRTPGSMSIKRRLSMESCQFTGQQSWTTAGNITAHKQCMKCYIWKVAYSVPVPVPVPHLKFWNYVLLFSLLYITFRQCRTFEMCSIFTSKNGYNC